MDFTSPRISFRLRPPLLQFGLTTRIHRLWYRFAIRRDTSSSSKSLRLAPSPTALTGVMSQLSSLLICRPSTKRCRCGALHPLALESRSSTQSSVTLLRRSYTFCRSSAHRSTAPPPQRSLRCFRCRLAPPPTGSSSPTRANRRLSSASLPSKALI